VILKNRAASIACGAAARATGKTFSKEDGGSQVVFENALHYIRFADARQRNETALPEQSHQTSWCLGSFRSTKKKIFGGVSNQQ